MESLRLNEYFDIIRTNQIQIEAKVIKSLTSYFREITDCNDSEKAISEIRKKAAVKVRYNSDLELCSAPRPVIERWILKMKFDLADVPGFKSESDLLTGKYEGGFKIWESTHDLIKFIMEDDTVIGEKLRRKGKLRVLELGAGSCLVSLALLNRIVNDPSSRISPKLHIQDYNWQVLITFSLINLALNFSTHKLKNMIDTRMIRMFCGDWKDFNYKHRYYFIMMSEVLYNSKIYESLHKLLSNHLKESGYVIIATKDTYFGLSGGLYSWLDFVKARDIFDIQNVIKVSKENVPRSIIIMERKGRSASLKKRPSNETSDAQSI